jgi:TonB family protein
MERKSKQGFVLSATLHGAVVALGLILPMIDLSDRDREKEFTLVPMPPLSGPTGGGTEDAPLTERTFDFTGPEQPPEPTPPKKKPPAPTPKEVTPPKPAPVKTPPPKPPVAKTPPKPAPKPKSELSYQDFIKQHGPPKTPVKKPPPTGTTGRAKGPRVDTDFSGVLRESMVDGSRYGSLSGTEISLLGAYVAGLRAALEAAWPKPTGLSSTLATVVEFSVSADGRLSNVRITISSGNAVFDSSVTSAFQAVGRVDPTPDKKSQRFRLTFRMNDG